MKEIGDFKKAVLSHLCGENGQPLNEDDFITDAQQPVSDDDDDDLDDWLNFAKDIQTINNDDDDEDVLLVEAWYTFSAYLFKINVYIYPY